MRVILPATSWDECLQDEALVFSNLQHLSLPYPPSGRLSDAFSGPGDPQGCSSFFQALS